METWQKILSIMVAIAAILILITITLNLLKTIDSRKKIKIEGNKEYVVSSIVNLLYKCFEENTGREESVICSRLFVSSTEEITSSDILNYIDPSRVDISSVDAEDLGYSTEIIIRYENQIIYVKKVENERIGA